MTAMKPSELIPRDETGSYLHLKLKRFQSIDDLSMKFAQKTWREHPHDVEIDLAPSNRSKCRQCHTSILKGELRVRLWLQCHKGCKNSAYFHGRDCIWEYPETTKIEDIKEFFGMEALEKKDQGYVTEKFDELKGKEKKKSRKVDQVSSSDNTTKPSPKKAKK